MKKNKLSKITVMFLGLISPLAGYTNSSYESTSSKIKILQKQIEQIKNKIGEDKEEHAHIQSALQKKINQLKQTQIEHKKLILKVQRIQLEILSIQNHLQQMKEKFEVTKKSIFEHLSLHLKLSEEPFWQVIFSAKNPFESTQRIDLYRYIYLSEQKKLIQLRESQLALEQQHQLMHQKMQQLATLEKELSQKEIVFNRETQQHSLALQKINNKILDHTQQLHVIEENQAKLKQLIQHLLKENHLQSSRPFTVMKQRLNYPVHTTPTVTRKEQNGLIFQAPKNAPVYAVSGGRIVFSDWLNGYGYLVIIDHGWGFMTLYGNNETLLAHKGQTVHQGEQIASVGKSGQFHQVGLYFEIRQKAKVVAAQSWFQNLKG